GADGRSLTELAGDEVPELLLQGVLFVQDVAVELYVTGTGRPIRGAGEGHFGVGLFGEGDPNRLVALGDQQAALSVGSDPAGQQARYAAVLEDDLGGRHVLEWTAVERATDGVGADHPVGDEAEHDVDVMDHQVEDDADVLDPGGRHQAPGFDQVGRSDLLLEQLDGLVEAGYVTHL